MIEEISIERAGGQDLMARLAALNTCALAGARRLSLNPGSLGRIRLEPASHASYRSLSDMEIAHYAAQPVFLFRPSSLVEAFAMPAASSPPPDDELVRRFLILARELALHAPAAPTVLLALDPADTYRARKLTDDEFEALQRNAGLTFEPRIEPVHQLRSMSADGWDPDRFMAQLARDLDCQLRRARKSR
jgi:hypothetical protein